MTEKRGINLGCGKLIMPCAKPEHHALIPDRIYEDRDIQWDNADWNGGAGVSLLVDLFDYPWRTDAGEVPDNTYDVAIAAHIVEHIPHHIVWNGALVHKHPDYQDGWYAWFGELNRILKPGGTAYILVPYAWSNSGMSDPTHTRYCTFATFYYFSPGENGSPFVYRTGARWDEIEFDRDVMWRPHIFAVSMTDALIRYRDAFMKVHSYGLLRAFDRHWKEDESLDFEKLDEGTQQEIRQVIFQASMQQLNMIPEFCVTIRKVADDASTS